MISTAGRVALARWITAGGRAGCAMAAPDRVLLTIGFQWMVECSVRTVRRNRAAARRLVSLMSVAEPCSASS